MSTPNLRSVEVNRFTFMVRWDTTLFPVETSQLVKILPERGFVVEDQVISQRPPFGTHVEITGLVGRKGSTALILDTTRPGISLDGVSPSDIMEEFEDLENQISTILKFNSRDNARFYELDVQALVSSESQTLESMRNYYAGSGLSELVGEAMGFPVSQYSFRACSDTAKPRDIDWYELLFESSIRGDFSYFTLLTFRNPDRSIVWDIASRYEDILRKVADVIERA